MKKLYGQYFVAVAVFCLVATFTSAATVASITCTSQGTECKAIANSTCDGSHCKCDAAFKEGTSTAEGTCVPIAVSEIDCSTNSAVCVTHSTCVGSGTKMCQCDSTYKEGTGTAINTCVPKALGDYKCPNGNGDCTGGTASKANSECVSGVCACSPAFKEVSSACVARVAVTATGCSANGKECSTIPNSNCGGSKCLCDPTYKEGTSPNIDTCVPKAVSEITCTTNGRECNIVSNSVCSGTTCACSSAYIQGSGANINTCVVRGLNETCKTNEECGGVSNAECVGTSTKLCTCMTNYKADKGQCNTANGLQTLLSAPVALLLSFLTIVVTRLQ